MAANATRDHDPSERYLGEYLAMSGRNPGSTAGLIILAVGISLFLCWFYIHADKKSSADDHFGYITSNGSLANKPMRTFAYDAPKLGARMTVIMEQQKEERLMMEARGIKVEEEDERDRLPPGYAQSRAGQPFEGRAPAGYEVHAANGWRDV